MKTILIFISFFIFHSFSYATQLCSAVMSGKQKIDHKLVYENNFYRLVEVLPGLHGGKKVVIERRDMSSTWKMPSSGENNPAPPGDPLIFFSVLGKDVRDFLGIKAWDENRKEISTPFSQKSPRYLVIPDFFELVGALRDLDALLTTHDYFGLPGRFYLGNKIVSDELFVRNYFAQMGFPFSVDNVISYHDFNYHLLPILMLNESQYKNSLVLSEIFIRFSEWLKLNHPDLATPQVLRKVFHIRAHQIDLTGNLGLFLKNPQIPKNEFDAKLAMQCFLGSGYSPIKYLTVVITKAQQSENFKELKGLNLNLISEFTQTLEPRFFVESPESLAVIKDPELLWLKFRERMIELQMALMGIPKQ